MSTESSVRSQIPGPLFLFRDWLPLPVPSLSLYVHVPFCESRCRYCNFYFETGWSPRVLQRTLDTILEESRTFRALLFPSPGRTAIRTIYLGGGTPSVIPPGMLDSFLMDFLAIWQPEPQGLVEFAFEANPESLQDAHFGVFARRGINRLSLGVQTRDDRILSLLGRKARAADVDRCLDLITRHRNGGTWTGKVNLDLMVGLPGQDQAGLDRDLDSLLAAQPDHVSVYTLTLEDLTSLKTLIEDLGTRPLGEEEAENLWLHAARRLESEGLENYEVSNFARPGCESRHNLSYWHLDPYLGLGPGAVSTLPCRIRDHTGAQAQESGRSPADSWIRLTNPHSFAYSRPGRPGWEHATEVLGPRDFLLEHFITGLRIREGLDLSRAESRTGLAPGSLARLLGPLAAKWEDRGLGHCRDQRLVLTLQGRLILNLLLGEILNLIDSMVFSGHSDQ